MEDVVLKTQLDRIISNTMPHHLTPHVRQLSLGALGCHVGTTEELFEQIPHQECLRPPHNVSFGFVATPSSTR